MRRRTIQVLLLVMLLAVAAGGLLGSRLIGATSYIVKTIPFSGGLFSIAIDARTGRAFGTDTASITTIDLRSGAVIGTITVAGAQPTQIAVYTAGGTGIRGPGAQSDRLFVTNECHSDLSSNPECGIVRVLDEASGTLVAQVNLGFTAEILAVAQRQGHVFVSAGFSGESVSMLDATRGTVLKTITLPERSRQILSDERSGRVFVTSQLLDHLYVLDAKTGKVLRTITFAQRLSALDSVLDEATGRVFMLSIDHFRFALATYDLKSGALLRMVPVGERLPAEQQVPPSKLMVDPRLGRVFVLHEGGVFAFDARTGRPAYHISTLGLPRSIAVDDVLNRVYVDTGSVIMVDGALGKILHVDGAGIGGMAGWPGTMTLAQHGDRLLALSVSQSPGKQQSEQTDLVVVDSRTGMVLKSMLQGANPWLLAVDDHTERAVVGTAGGTITVPSAYAWVPGWLRHVLPFLPAASTRTRFVAPSIVVIDTSRL